MHGSPPAHVVEVMIYAVLAASFGWAAFVVAPGDGWLWAWSLLGFVASALLLLVTIASALKHTVLAGEESVGGEESGG